MSTTYNLIDEAWIPCVMADERTPRSFGLRDTLARAPDIREIAAASPLVTVALHRLLLAMLHRVFGPADSDAWAILWERGRWDKQRIEAYLEQWRQRFELFSESQPFYQDARLDFQYAVPICKRAHEIASYTHVTLFDHTLETERDAVSPAQAARFLVGHQAFTVGGLVSLERGQDAKLFKSANAAPLNKGAVGLVRGETLFETLMLNLHQYSPEDGQPFECEGDDRPAWERDEPPSGSNRLPTGYLDLLTWQSRKMRLEPELNAVGATVIQRAVIMKGDQFPGHWHRRGHETMVAFTRVEKPAKGADPWPAVAFRADQVLWRDSLALIQSADNRTRPKVLDWVHDLVSEGLLDRQRALQLDFCGLSTNKAVVNFWRHERVSLPVAYLERPPLVEALREALLLAEGVATALGSSGWRLATLALAPNSDAPAGREPKPDIVRGYRGRLRMTPAYWSRLEVPFRELIADLADDLSTSDESGEIYGQQALPRWAERLRQTAWAAFREATDGLDLSPRTLKSVVVAERELALGLHRALDETVQSR